MSRLRAFLDRFAALFSKRRREAELAEEIDSHLALSIEENLRRGISPEDARHAALRSFGGVEQMKETYRDRRSIPFVETFVQDLRHGARSLRRSPAVWALAVLTLGVGLGANATIFTIVRAILLRPIEIFDPGRTVVIYSANTRQSAHRSKSSKADYLAWRERARSFETMVACDMTIHGLAGQGEPVRLRVARVSPGYFDFFGVQPAAGRFPRPEESEPGRNNVVVLSHGFWTERFARDPSVIGTHLRLDDAMYTVIGVAPPEFWFPSDRAQLWRPFEAQAGADPGARFLTVLGRLRPEVSREQGRQELSDIARDLERENPKARAGWGVLVQTPYEGLFSQNDRTGVVLLYVVAAGVLLISCANVANLLLARAVSRRKEIAVRVALGASRTRLARQSLTENLLLAVPAGALGVVFAQWSASVVVRSFDLTIRLPETLVDGKAVAFTMAVAVLSVLVFGMAPSLAAARLDLAPALKEGGARAGLGRRSHWMRRAFLVVQTSLALALVATAALTYKGVRALQIIDPGFPTANLVLVDLEPAVWRYAGDAAVRRFFAEVLRRLGETSQVQRAAAVSAVPSVDSNGNPTMIAPADHPEPPLSERPAGTYILATPGAIETLGVPMERGRSIQAGDHEDSPRVVVINRTAANSLWPGEDPIGKGLRLEALGGRWFSVVGVVRDVLPTKLTDRPAPQFFVPWAQSSRRAMTLVIRTTHAATAIPGIRGAVREVDSEEPLQVRTAEAEMYDGLRGSRTVTGLFSVFAALALFLAATGLFSLISQAVGERARELGIRLAFGASGADLVRLLLVEGLGLTTIGAAAGILMAVPLGRVLASTGAPIDPADPVVLSLSYVLLASVTLMACYLPARRATWIDPVTVLRNE